MLGTPLKSTDFNINHIWMPCVVAPQREVKECNKKNSVTALKWVKRSAVDVKSEPHQRGARRLFEYTAPPRGHGQIIIHLDRTTPLPLTLEPS